MIKLAPSILSADFSRLGKEIQAVREAGAHYIHIDVMDGHFVPNISIGPVVVKSLRPVSDAFFDVHLMIENPERYFEAFCDAGADLINFHLEASKDPLADIRLIKSLGKKAGITIKPGTPVEDVYPYLEQMDLVLIMSVEPGFGGQALIPGALVKARKLKDIITERRLPVEVEMDGGIYLENLRQVIEAGVDVVVAGSAVFKGGKPEERVGEFYRAFDGFK